jgi:hypothetical protein
LAASVIPYAVRFVADDHLHLLLFEERLTPPALAGLAAALTAAVAALGYWMNEPPPPRSGEPVERKIGRQSNDLEKAGNELA